MLYDPFILDGMKINDNLETFYKAFDTSFEMTVLFGGPCSSEISKVKENGGSIKIHCRA